MKLDRFTSFAMSAATAVSLAGLMAFASGCSATTSQAPKSATSATLANVAGTTSLMSAELAAPAPRVGKSHLAVDDAADADTTNSDESAPKEARRSDGSHRGGSFGMSSK